MKCHEFTLIALALVSFIALLDAVAGSCCGALRVTGVKLLHFEILRALAILFSFLLTSSCCLSEAQIPMVAYGCPREKQ